MSFSNTVLQRFIKINEVPHDYAIIFFGRVQK
jgi:hypothetical protein